MASTEIESTTDDIQQFVSLLEAVRSGATAKVESFLNSHGSHLLKATEPQLNQNAYFFALDIPDEDKCLTMFQFLLAKGCSVTHKDSLQQTVLFYTAKEGKVRLSEFVLANGVEANARDVNYQTPLFYAAREGKAEIVDLFVKHGADLNLQDTQGQSCIFYAVKEGHIDFIKEVLAKGGKVNMADKKRITPLSLARKLGKQQVEEVLVSFGADHPSKAKLKAKKPISKGGHSNSFVLCRNGGKTGRTPLSKEELFSLFSKYPDLKTILGASQMEKQWVGKAEEMLEKLWCHKAAEIFKEPVDPVALGVPTYFEIVKQPMDFGTIKNKLKRGEYENIEDFESDIELVFSNCYLFNGKESEVGKICSEVESFYLEALK